MRFRSVAALESSLEAKHSTLDELVFSVSLVAASASAISPISKASSDEN
jgi:hypothetical protein